MESCRSENIANLDLKSATSEDEIDHAAAQLWGLTDAELVERPRL